MKKIVSTFMCLGVLGCASPRVHKGPDAAQPVQMPMIPILAKATGVSMFTCDMTWRLRLFADGRARAGLGLRSSLGPLLTLPKGSIQFRDLYLSIVEKAQLQSDQAHSLCVSVSPGSAALYIDPKDLPEALRSLQDLNWQNMSTPPFFTNGVAAILKEYPMKVITEQSPAGDDLKAPPEE